MTNYQLDKQIGNVKIAPYNLFVDNLNVQEVEDWEYRLERLGEPYTVAFKTNRHGQIVYGIFVVSGKKNGAFKA